MKRQRLILLSAAALPLALSTFAHAETIAYRYDARGRLVEVRRTGTPTPRTTAYVHDRADNRTRKTVTSP